MRQLILGGARSGKSVLAEQRAQASQLRVLYIATAEVRDYEMAERVMQHRVRRPPSWVLLECPLYLAAALQRQAAPETCILVDCLTVWLSNLMHAGHEVLEREKEALLALLPTLPGQIVLVSNEVGEGIVPANDLARRFRDEAGWLNQAVAALCERVTFTVAGLPLELKGGA